MFSRLCIKKPVTTIMVTLMVFIAGILSYTNLDQAMMPDMDLPIAVVATTYVGASPEEIETLISNRDLLKELSLSNSLSIFNRPDLRFDRLINEASNASLHSL